MQERNVKLLDYLWDLILSEMIKTLLAYQQTSLLSVTSYDVSFYCLFTIDLQLNIIGTYINKVLSILGLNQIENSNQQT